MATRRTTKESEDTTELRRLAAEATLQERKLKEIQDVLIVDEDGHVQPAPAGRSILDMFDEPDDT